MCERVRKKEREKFRRNGETTVEIYLLETSMHVLTQTCAHKNTHTCIHERKHDEMQRNFTHMNEPWHKYRPATSHGKMCDIRRMNEAKKLYTNKSRNTSIIDNRAGRLRLKGEKGAAENAAPTDCRHSPPSADPPWLPNLNHQLCSYLTHITSTTCTDRRAHAHTCMHTTAHVHSRTNTNSCRI